MSLEITWKPLTYCTIGNLSDPVRYYVSIIGFLKGFQVRLKLADIFNITSLILIFRHCHNWRILPFSKWLVFYGRLVSPLTGVVPFSNGLFTNYLLCRVILHWSKWRSARSLSQIPKKVKPWNKMERFVSNIWQRVQSLKLTNQPLKIGKSPKKTNFCLPSLWIFRCKLAVNFMEGIYVIWSQVDKLWQDIFEIAVCFLCGPLPVRVTTRITTVFVLVGDSRDELLRSSRYIMSPRWWQRSGWLVGSLTNSWHLYLCNYIISYRHIYDYAFLWRL